MTERCSICLKALNATASTALFCTHTYCTDCIATYIEKMAKSQQNICCPLCRHTIDALQPHWGSPAYTMCPPRNGFKF